MDGLVVGHFQTVRGDHAVKSQLSCQPVVQVAVRLLLRIDLLCQGRLFCRRLFYTAVVRSNGHVLLRVGSSDAHSEGKHDDYFSHITLDFSGKLNIGYCYFFCILFSVYLLIEHDPVPGFQMHFHRAHLLGDILARALYQPLAQVGGELPMLAATSLTAFISIEFGMKMPGCPSVSYTASSTGIIVPAYSSEVISISSRSP